MSHFFLVLTSNKLVCHLYKKQELVMPAKKQKGNSLLGNVRPYFENFTNKVKIK